MATTALGAFLLFQDVVHAGSRFQKRVAKLLRLEASLRVARHAEAGARLIKGRAGGRARGRARETGPSGRGRQDHTATHPRAKESERAPA
eukprot:11354529-Alexandrium_andersonii.AAC.1